jgi:hypothetical protein
VHPRVEVSVPVPAGVNNGAVVPSSQASATAAGVVAVPPAESEPVNASVPAPAPSEGGLLLRARQKLAADPAGALALADEDAVRFPGGALAPEREVLAIEALARLGRSTDARARLASFRARYPESPHLTHLAEVVRR